MSGRLGHGNNDGRHRSHSRNRHSESTHKNINKGGGHSNRDMNKDGSNKFESQKDFDNQQPGDRDWLSMQKMSDPFSQFAREHFGTNQGSFGGLVGQHDGGKGVFGGVSYRGGAGGAGAHSNLESASSSKNPEFHGIMDGLNDPHSFQPVDIDQNLFESNP